MTTLYERLTARIGELERIAKAAMPAGIVNERWYMSAVAGDEWRVRERSTEAPVADVIGGVFGDRGEEYARHITAWDPATVLRGLEEDRAILQRHALPDRVPIEDLPPYPCEWCSRRASDPAFTVWVDWPCEEIRSLARRHGVEVTS